MTTQTTSTPRSSSESCNKMGVKRPVMALASLPNEAGFLFFGARKDGSVCDCVVVRGASGNHSVGGGAVYGDLVGWSRKPTGLQAA